VVSKACTFCKITNIQGLVKDHEDTFHHQHQTAQRWSDKDKLDDEVYGIW
jgi:hypothetical protein